MNPTFLRLYTLKHDIGILINIAHIVDIMEAENGHNSKTITSQQNKLTNA